MRRRMAALAAAALGGVAEAARRGGVPGAFLSAFADEEEDRDAKFRSECADLSPDLARHVLDHAPLSYRVASADTIGTAVFLWDRRDLGVLAGHGGAIAGLAMFPSGDMALTWGQDGAAIVWDMESREIVKTLCIHVAVECARIFPGGDRVLTCGAESICVVWDVGSWAKVCEVGFRATPGYHWVPALQLFTGADLFDGCGAEVLPPGDGVVTLGRGAQATLWDVPSGEKRCALRGRPVNLVVPFSDGNSLVTVSFEDPLVFIWSAHTCALRLALRHAEWVVDIAVLGGAVLSMDMHGLVSVWEKDSWILLRTLHAPSVIAPTYELWPFPDGHRLATVYRRNVVIWNVTSGVALHNISYAGAEGIAIAPAGDALAVCSGWRVATFDTHTGAELPLPRFNRSLHIGDGSCFVAMSWGTVLGDGVRGPSWRSLEERAR